MPVFNINVMPERSPETCAVWTDENEKLYVSVSFIQHVGTVISESELKERRESLGGRSVLEMLLQLEGPEADIEKE
jgi:hypothetical protein